MNRGYIMAVVITMSVILLGMISVLFFKSRAQKNTQSFMLDQARAQLAAQSIMNLAICKFRLLASEYYLLESVPPEKIKIFQDAWLADFNSKCATTPAFLLCAKMNCEEMGVSSFTRLILTQPGLDYKKNILRIEAYAVFNKRKRILEQLVEIDF